VVVVVRCQVLHGQVARRQRAAVEGELEAADDVLVVRRGCRGTDGGAAGVGQRGGAVDRHAGGGGGRGAGEQRQGSDFDGARTQSVDLTAVDADQAHAGVHAAAHRVGGAEVG